MIVWRYEHHQTHCGPYNSGINSEVADLLRLALCAEHCPNPDRTCWHDDAVLREFEHHNFSTWRAGCSTFQALKNHFEGYWEILPEAGFELVALDVDDDSVVFGDDHRQVAFDSGRIYNRTVIEPCTALGRN